ncbi:MAG TPA: alpha/beta fold hydrolase [Kofleriaceae bacterium]|nr:alpha/beta fold hydrolase [Kofleriaceae bacterium]
MTRWGYAVAPSDGTSLFYERCDGDPGRAPVALLDGVGCDGYAWRHLRRTLHARSIVHPHYRGHGRSSPPRDPARVSIEDLADDVAAVLDDAGVERAALCGHSMGVQVALEMFRRHRDRVAGLVLVCGASSNPLRTFRGTATLERLLPDVQRWLARAPRAVNRVLRAVVPTKLSFEIAKRLEINGELVDPADFMPYLEGLARIDATLFAAMLAAAGTHSADDLLASIDVPTLVIAGARDGFTPPDRSVAMAEAIPGAQLLLIEDGSHTTPIERPEQVNRAIADLLVRSVDESFTRTSAELQT